MTKVMKRTYELRGVSHVYVQSYMHDEQYTIVGDFLNMDADVFPDIFMPLLEGVLFEGVEDNSFGGNMLNIEFDKNLITIEHQMDEDYLAKPCSIDTLTFYKLIKEFLYVKRELRTQPHRFPITLEDGEWLYD